MTLKNHKLMQKLEFTGSEGFGNCFVAACDAVSKKHSSTAGMYIKYHNAFVAEQAGEGSPRITEQIMGRVVQELGADERYVSNRRITDLEGLDRALEGAKKGARRVIIFTAENHVIGLVPEGDGWKPVGNLPEKIKPHLKNDDVFCILAQPKGRRKGERFENLITLPPEKK